MVKKEKSTIKDIYNGEGMYIWEDESLVFIDIGATVLRVEKEHWEAIKRDFEKLLGM